jgi:hypothetical protein
VEFKSILDSYGIYASWIVEFEHSGFLELMHSGFLWNLCILDSYGIYAFWIPMEFMHPGFP